MSTNRMFRHFEEVYGADPPEHEKDIVAKFLTTMDPKDLDSLGEGMDLSNATGEVNDTLFPIGDHVLELHEATPPGAGPYISLVAATATGPKLHHVYLHFLQSEEMITEDNDLLIASCIARYAIESSSVPAIMSYTMKRDGQTEHSTILATSYRKRGSSSEWVRDYDATPMETTLQMTFGIINAFLSNDEYAKDVLDKAPPIEAIGKPYTKGEPDDNRN